MAASLLAAGTTRLTNVPDIGDVPIMGEVLRGLGADVIGDAPGLSITVPDELGHEADYEHVRRIRGSVCVLGPLIARTGRARVALPGGDAIGSRSLDLHVMGLERLGAVFDNAHGYLVAEAPELRGAQIWLDFPSVGATENIMMAAVLAKGTTTIDNAAREPEIVDLCEMLVAMGAQIGGIGTSTLEIEASTRCTPTAHDVVADRIVAGTWAFAAAMTHGDIRVRGARAEPPRDRAGQARAGRGDGRRRTTTGSRVSCATPAARGRRRDAALPGLPDRPAADGDRAELRRRRRRLRHREHLRGPVHVHRRAGAARRRRRTDGHHAIVRGREQLSGAPVRATDIRAGAALVLAGLVADGVTTVADAFHVDRGYQSFVETLTRSVPRSAGSPTTPCSRPRPASCQRHTSPEQRVTLTTRCTQSGVDEIGRDRNTGDTDQHPCAVDREQAPMRGRVEPVLRSCAGGPRPLR